PDGKSVNDLRHLAAVLDRRADAHLRAGNIPAAEADAIESHKLFRRVIGIDATSRQARRGPARGGRPGGGGGPPATQPPPPPAALSLFQRSAGRWGELQAADPDCVQAKEDRAVALERLAHGYRFGGPREACLAAEFEALKLREQVVQKNPNSLTANRALMAALRRVGGLALDDRNLAKARNFYTRAVAVPGKVPR